MCTMFVCGALSAITLGQFGSMNVVTGAKWKAGLVSMVFSVSQALVSNPQDVGIISTLISNDADRVFAAGQFVGWAGSLVCAHEHFFSIISS